MGERINAHVYITWWENPRKDEKKKVEAALSCSTDPNCYQRWGLAVHCLKVSTGEESW